MYLACTTILVAAAAIIGIGIRDVRELRHMTGVRRERRRTIFTTVFGAGALLWVLLSLVLPTLPTSLRMLCIMWPLLLIGTDLVNTLYHVPTQESMVANGNLTQQSGNWIIGAVFAAGVLLSTLNKTQSGHLPASARVMLLSVLGILAGLVPPPGAGPSSDLFWTVYAAQRVVLHSAIGLFIFATALAWR